MGVDRRQAADERVEQLERRVRELEAVEQRYRTLLDHIPDSVLRLERDLRYSEVNQRVCNALGLRRDQIIGHRLSDLGLPPAIESMWNDVFRQVLATGGTQVVHGEAVGRVYESVVVPERNAAGAVESVLIVARDVTDRHRAEEARQASEARLRLLVEQVPAILWTTDRDLRFTSFLGAGLAAAGIDADEATGVLLPEFRGRKDAIVQAHRNALCGESVTINDTWENRSYRSRIEPLRDADGQIVGCIGVALDVTELRAAELSLRELNEQLERRVAQRTAELTAANERMQREIRERKRVEEELRKSEALFRAVSEQMPDVLWLLDADPKRPADMGRIVLTNQAAARASGYTIEELVGRSLFELEDPETRAGSPQRMARYQAGETLVVEGKLRRRDGTFLPMEATARKIEYGGRPVVLSICRDLTPRYAAEKQLRLVESAVEQVHEAVVITDAALDPPGPRIIYVNPAFESMTGYTAEEVIGQTPRILQGPGTSRAVLDDLRAALAQGRAFHGQTVNYRKDGTPFDLEWDIAPIRNEVGEIINWVSIQRDVTEQKRAAQVAAQHQAELEHVARLSTMGEMASGLAHELNQPLAAILNYARGALRRMDQPGDGSLLVREALGQIAGQAERSGQIIQRLRRFVRKREPRRDAAELNAIVEEAVSLVRGEAHRRQVDIVLHLGSSLPPVSVDTIQIEQVLLNLISNAMDAMAGNPASHRRVDISTAANPKGGAIVRVRDHGHGATDEQLDHLFDPFFTTKETGMGMGLTISQTITEAHDGTLGVSRNPDGGLTFNLALPAGDSGA